MLSKKCKCVNLKGVFGSEEIIFSIKLRKTNKNAKIASLLVLKILDIQCLNIISEKCEAPSCTS